MRTRQQIEDSWKGAPNVVAKLDGTTQVQYRPSGTYIEGLMLEILLDIRDLLSNN